jgi:hypothetical protein
MLHLSPALKQRRLLRGGYAIALGLALASCSHSPKDAHFQESIIGWSQVEKLDPTYVIFGEIHGTKESAEFFSDVASMLAGRGKRVLVAVELSASGDAYLQQVWNGPKTGFAARLTKGEWAIRKDGVASEAMLAMLTRLHTLKADGAKLSVVAFNGFRDDTQRLRLDTFLSQSGHEAAQAENIIAAAQQKRFDYVLVLVGGFHSIRKEVELEGKNIKPMAMHLAASGTLVSLKMAYSGGTGWHCILKSDVQPSPGQQITTEMLDCGIHPMRAEGDSAIASTLKDTKHIGLHSSGDHDGYYWLGQVSGSPPAHQRRLEE